MFVTLNEKLARFSDIRLQSFRLLNAKIQVHSKRFEVGGSQETLRLFNFILQFIVRCKTKDV